MPGETLFVDDDLAGASVAQYAPRTSRAKVLLSCV
jgi:hypothetical protein